MGDAGGGGLMAIGRTGRPSIYEPLLKRIRDINKPGEFHVVRRDHKTNTVLSQLHTRYPDFMFRAEKQADGTYHILAAWRGKTEG